MSKEDPVNNIARDKVSDVISPQDTMLDGAGVDTYLKIGEGALSHCKRALGDRVPERIVDFPCGYGRVMRWFRHEWPNAEIFGVETDGGCLEFVKNSFSAKPIQADPNLKMTIPGDVDLIFSGSFLTHFDEWQWRIYIEMCCDALSEDGVFIFTTHGRIASILAKDRHPVYGDLVDTRELYERQKGPDQVDCNTGAGLSMLQFAPVARFSL